jgi:tubulin monoglycylase TTLL15
LLLASADKQSKMRKNKKNEFSFLKIMFWLFSLVIMILSVLSVKYNFRERFQAAFGANSNKLKYWPVCIDDYSKSGTLKTHTNVFHRLGYENATGDDNWDVLWSNGKLYNFYLLNNSRITFCCLSEYPFPYLDNFPKVFKPVVNPLKLHQRINHIPGINYVTLKSFMATQNFKRNKYVLPAFEFPAMIDEFKEFVVINPKARFVVKNDSNRGIKIVDLSEVNYKSSKSFYQVFMEKPFLIDDRMMDISVFVAVTSINPLRIYRYENDVHLRFCKEPYYPFDAKILNKYVVSDDRLDVCDLPSLNFYHEKFGLSFKKSFEAYLRTNGFDPNDLWRQIDEALVQVFLDNEPSFMYEVCNK